MNRVGTDPIIDLDDVFVLYRGPTRDVAALRGLSLQVQQGERVVIHGPSGAGKSTFVKLITAVITPNAGNARLFDHELTALDQEARTALRRESIGIITQHSGDDLAPELTCAQNVALQPALQGSDAQQRRAAAMSALQAVGVGHLAHRRPSKLSHGELQRVAIAVAIAQGPRLLVADEPTGQLDVGNADEMLDILIRVAAESAATLIIATHDETAARLADRVLTIADGRLSEERRRGEATSSAVVDERGWLRLSLPAREYARIGGRATVTQHESGLIITARGDDLQEHASPVAVDHLDDDAAGDSVVRRLGDVTMSFGDTAVLVDVTATVRRGQLQAVVGRSGSGKTTLLSILSGWMPPTSGVVECPSGDVDVAACPAVPAFPEGLTVQEVLDLTMRITGSSPDRTKRDMLLGSLGLGDLGARLTTELSGGERQRLAVARCLITEATLMLLDEPTAQLDRRNARRVIDLLAGAARRSAVVCATHDVELIDRADTVCSLDAVNP